MLQPLACAADGIEECSVFYIFDVKICRPGEVECVPSGTTRSVRWMRAKIYAWRTLTLQMLTNGFNRPVLKHGPRSLTYARVLGCQTTEA